MYTLMILIFVIGYIAIAFEHTIHVDKAAVALLIGVGMWSVLILGEATIFPTMDGEISTGFIEKSLMEHLADTASIVFFLLGAMTIVEVIDSHGGFSVITDRIKTTHRVKLLWILCLITFFLSAMLDNLTTSIVMAALIRKLMKDKSDIWLFAGMIIIAANAGGVWSPIGDVTTIMLWIGQQVSASNIVGALFLPSLTCLLVPLIFLSLRLKGDVSRPHAKHAESDHDIEVIKRERSIVFYLGIGALLFVPVFKTITHLPPFMGVLFGLSLMWIVTEVLHRGKEVKAKRSLTLVGNLSKVDTPSILFFLGILLAVASLQTAGHLNQLAFALEKNLGNIYLLNTVIGALSSIVDNVPLVAGAIGMYPLDVYPQDHTFWELLALCAGTGGSMLIIGSAAGVAVMGILKIDFMWYLKHITLWALIGYLAGIGVYMLM